MKNDKVTVVRLPDDLRREWLAVCKKDGKESAYLIREMIAAAIRYHERNGNLYPPFALVPAARTPEERFTYTVSAKDGVIINGDNHGPINVTKKGAKR